MLTIVVRLLLSGIGPEDDLAEVGIPTYLANENVGRQ